VYRSSDGVDWSRQESRILESPGEHPEDREIGRHADVVVTGDTAVVFYFTHPGFDGAELSDASAPAARRTAIHVAELAVRDGLLVADRSLPDVSSRYL
jgi:hypothetical protein